jgi:tRNA(Ile)-lysidine synthase
VSQGLADADLPLLVGRFMQQLPAMGRLWMALSGGLDSTVLLHALCAARQRGLITGELAAVHVNHGLSSTAPVMAQTASRLARSLEVPLWRLRVHPARRNETAAREARYGALQALLRPGDVLLTAHHRDDQAETFLLQALRGHGVAGCAAMPAMARLGYGHLARPLLTVPRATLADYARNHGLQWIEDPGNVPLDVPRNALRHMVMPALEAIAPDARGALCRAAGQAARTAALLTALAQADLAGAVPEPGMLDWRALGHLDDLRRSNALHHWLKDHGLHLALPALDELMRQLEQARADRHPLLRSQGHVVRWHRGLLHLLPDDRGKGVQDCEALAWPRPQEPLALLADRSQLLLRDDGTDGGLDVSFLQRSWTVRLRRGGERLRLPGRSHRHAVKDLLQQRAMPPWQRQRLPLVYVDDELAAVPGVAVGAAFWSRESRWMVHWEPGTAAGQNGEKRHA